MSSHTLRGKRIPSPKATLSKNRSSPAPQSTPMAATTLAEHKQNHARSSTSTSATSQSRYFLIVASRDHVRTAVEGGFVQANHGKKAPMMQMKKGDGVVFYSARETYTPKSKGKPEGKVCQKFTGLGRVKDDNVYQLKVFDGFEPYRRKAEYEKGRDVSILPLVEKLDFIRDKTHWGASLRFGFLKIAEEDWKLIQSDMLKEQA